jgi:L-ascorbate metabolism protein UlaG (beta-lactamase superfamily)
MALRNSFLAIAFVGALPAAPATLAQQSMIPPPEQPVSQCLAVAQSLPSVQYADFTPASTMPIGKEEVRITFAGHSTYVLETAAGVSIATDYNGWSAHVAVPRIVTMNKAHSTHYTRNPDPRIEHVLRGWNPQGGPADHDVIVEDVYVRNVPTDIRAHGAMEADGNSIFIFEVAGLCIGHLGHLHHALEDRHYAAIGRLDIVMVPVDGGLTLSHEGMSEITERLYSSIVLPMHRQGPYAERFITMMSESFAVDFRDEPSFTVSMKTLPSRPTIVVLAGAI